MSNQPSPAPTEAPEHDLIPNEVWINGHVGERVRAFILTVSEDQCDESDVRFVRASSTREAAETYETTIKLAIEIVKQSRDAADAIGKLGSLILKESELGANQ